ncbi:sigma-70 family RNA polymerase sigma factor [Sinomicrobium kalidii]|uniref:RNA polymerase sigma factor n=1 Tax=Sinomicrobium kalidii TaxID=2900738 RepID=UPI001E3FD2D7|nr:sigma-70 family RNA polymerase sigma factor [Sinomicrobium kalidii]UGU16467.1 sigma-70 family RNA polymerase sigma factor [Sinomicrobium kalidii]
MDIIKNLKKGNKATLECLYKMHYSKLYGFAGKFRLSHVSPDDIVQQTFLKIWEQRFLLKEDVPFEKQLYTISKNTILNHLKKENKIIRFDDMLIVDGPVINDEDNSDDKNSERLKIVYKKLNEMPKRRREIFEMHKLHGLSYHEISEILKISKNTIANHLRLATLDLKKECREPSS